MLLTIQKWLPRLTEFFLDEGQQACGLIDPETGNTLLHEAVRKTKCRSCRRKTRNAEARARIAARIAAAKAAAAPTPTSAPTPVPAAQGLFGNDGAPEAGRAASEGTSEETANRAGEDEDHCSADENPAEEDSASLKILQLLSERCPSLNSAARNKEHKSALDLVRARWSFDDDEDDGVLRQEGTSAQSILQILKDLERLPPGSVVQMQDLEKENPEKNYVNGQRGRVVGWSVEKGR